MIRKIRLIVLGLLFLTAALAFFATRLLDSEPVRERFVRHLGDRLEGEISLESLELAWFPLPHLRLGGIEFEQPPARIVLPEVQIHPRWRSLARLSLQPGRIILEDPRLIIAAAAADSGPALSPSEDPAPALPTAGDLFIRRGSIAIAGRTGPAGLKIPDLQLDEVNGRIIMRPERLRVDLSARPSFGNSLDLQGWYEPGGAHNITASGQALRLDEIVSSLGHGRAATLKTSVNLNLELAGSSRDDFTAVLKGDLPCFLLNPDNDQVRLECGEAHLELSRRQDDWRLLIHNFEATKPGLRLSGLISREMILEEDAITPYWVIDLTGTDLDAGEIRKVVLALLGQYEATQIVCDIVLNGRARRAGFYFSGPQHDLNDFRKMYLEVDVETAEIMVPEVDLHLHDATGQLWIEEGILELRQASASLGESRGRNCSLTVGVFRELRQFRLDLDLEATLPDLHQVLPGLIEHPLFQAETARFHRPEGLATGHLYIGDTLDQFNVLVTIETLEGSAENERLPWPLKVESARATITRDEVSWSRLQGNIGPHRIDQAAGRIGIDETIPFGLKEFEGELAAGPLFDHLREYPALARALAPVLTNIEGLLEVRRGRAAGLLTRPESWDYHFSLTPGELIWHSPFLAADIATGEGTLLLETAAVQFQELKGDLLNDPLTLNGALRHRLLQEWRGEIRLAGLMTTAGRQWLQEREWLPAYLLPSAPLVFEPLTLHMARVGPEPETILSGLEGVLKSGPDEAQLTLAFTTTLPAAHTRLAGDSASEGNGRGLTLDLTLDDRRRRADIALELGPLPARQQDEPPAINLDFRGELAGDSLKRFFDRLPFSRGVVRGEAEFRLPEGARAPIFRGEIIVENLGFTSEEALDPGDPPPLPPLAGLSLHLKAMDDDDLLLHYLDLAFSAEEQLRLTGLIHADPAAGISVDLKLDSPLLRRSTLFAWRDRFSNPDRQASAAGTPEEPARWPLDGSIAFSLERFESGPATELRPDEEDGSDQVPLIWQPLHGRLALFPAGGVSAEIENGVICCLKTTGTWYSDPALGISNFKIVSSCPDASFEKILPCFGVDQDVIIGSCLVDAELHGELGFWREGRFKIGSPGGGRIMRLKLLSRIFSLVNLTDIYSGGIAGLDERGFAYKALEFEGRIGKNVLRVDRGVVRGEGLNLFVQGTVDLTTYQSRLTVMIATFKTLDAIIGWIPFIGKALGGPDTAIITIPVGVRGDIREPEITVLHPEAVGTGMLNLLRNTLLLPFNILSPIIKKLDDNNNNNEYEYEYEYDQAPTTGNDE